MVQTSQTIKHNQSQPPRILRTLDQMWEVEGRSRPSYWVTRSQDGRAFYCTCAAGQVGLLCRHVQAVVLELAGVKGFSRVAFWTHREDKEKQHRSDVQLQTRKRYFWVTFRWPEEVPRGLHVGDKIIKVQKDKWSGFEDAYYRANDGRWYRQKVRQAA